MFSRNALAALALLATTALAQSGGIPGLPSCAQDCVTNYGGCKQVDVGCICTNTDLLSTLSCCVSKQCDADGQKAVITFADSICNAYNKNLPTQASCAPGVSYTGTATGGSGSSTGTMSMTSGASTESTGTASSGTMTGTSSAAAQTQSEGVAPKMYPAEQVGLGMAVLGFLAAL